MNLTENTNNIAFVIDRDKATSIIGEERWDSKLNKMVIDQRVIPRSEGEALKKLLKKRDAERAKLAKAAGQPVGGKEEYMPKMMRLPNGRPVSIEEIMSVKKKSSS